MEFWKNEFETAVANEPLKVYCICLFSHIILFRIGRKKSLYIGLMVMLISAVSLTFAPEFYSFAAIYFILGSASVSNVMSAFVICK